MEGTVTISLKDYEDLKAEEEARKHFSSQFNKQIRLLEKIETYFKENGIQTDFTKEISTQLNKWY